MLKITATGNLTNDVELKMNEATGKPYLTMPSKSNMISRMEIRRFGNPSGAPACCTWTTWKS